MPRTFEVRQEFDLPAAKVHAMLIDPAYIRMRAERTGSISVEVEEASGPDGVALRITRVLPTDAAPSYARGLLGDAITVAESQAWSPLEAGSATATMEATFGSLVRLAGTIELIEDGPGTVVTTRATCKASVPLVGGKVESLIEQQVREYLAYEVELARQWQAAGD